MAGKRPAEKNEMCDANGERFKMLTCTVEPLSEECRACRQRLRNDSDDGASKVGNPGLIGNEAQGITISRCPQRAI